MEKNAAHGSWVGCEALAPLVSAEMLAVGPQFDPLTMPMPPVGLAPSVSDKVAFTEPTGGLLHGLLHRQRVTAVLRGVVEAFDLAAAELCLLDDPSTELRSAAGFGDLTPAAARPLESARADVTAMAGSAIVMEGAEMVADWRVPRRCCAAVCLPVATDTTIHGTLWLYNATPREFSDRELQMMEIVAGRLAVEEERRRLLDASESITAAAPALQLPCPVAPSDLGELELGGWSQEQAAGAALHDWATLADGRLLLVAASVVETPGGGPAESALAGQAARVAARCHADAAFHRGHRPSAGELMTHVADAVWQATPGGEGLSMALALVDREDCVGDYALAGGAVAMAVRASRTRVEATESAPVGWDRDERYASHRFELSLRERLVLSVSDPRAATPMRVDALADAYRGLSSETHRRMTADAAAALLRDRNDAPHAAVAVRWK